MKEKIKFWFKTGLWTKEMVMNAVPKLLKEKDAKEIVGGV